MLLASALFFVGLVILYYGAEFLVEGSSRFALSFGVRPLIVGMTVVALATSMPELMVSLFAAFKDSPDIAAGNIIGSNIANIGLILGVSALFSPVTVSSGAVKREIPIMLGASLLLYAVVFDGILSYFDGLLLLVALTLFLAYCVYYGRSGGGGEESQNVSEDRRRGRGKDFLYILVGIVGLAFGADLMVRSAVTIARSLGISELVIGLTVVAVGTSLPELAASAVSAVKGEADISVGNVIGSNIFNLLFVLGVCALIHPLAIEPSVLRIQIPVMLFFSFALIPLLGRTLTLGRSKGGILTISYVLFIVFLFL